MQTYLHEDFDDDFRDVWGAVEQFVRDNSEEARRIRGEVSELLATVSAESELKHVIYRELGSAYNPAVHGWTFRDWLAAVADRVDGILNARDKETTE